MPWFEGASPTLDHLTFRFIPEGFVPLYKAPKDLGEVPVGEYGPHAREARERAMRDNPAQLDELRAIWRKQNASGGKKKKAGGKKTKTTKKAAKTAKKPAKRKAAKKPATRAAAKKPAKKAAPRSAAKTPAAAPKAASKAAPPAGVPSMLGGAPTSSHGLDDGEE